MTGDDSAYLAIQRLQRGYADLATRRAFHEVTGLATPDAHFTFDTHTGSIFEIHGAAEFGEFSQKMIGGFSFFEYIPLNFTVDFASDGTAHGRSYTLEVAQDAETGDWIEFYGSYRDDYALFEGEWRFTRRRYRTYGRRTSGRLDAYPLEEPGA